jgi:hypothetical protein
MVFINPKTDFAFPPTMGEVAEIQQAFEMANQATLTPEELDELEHQLFFIQDQRGAIARATQLARQEERRQTQCEIARRLLGSMGDAAIAKMTGLAIADIQKLKQSENL